MPFRLSGPMIAAAMLSLAQTLQAGQAPQAPGRQAERLHPARLPPLRRLLAQPRQPQVYPARATASPICPESGR